MTKNIEAERFDTVVRTLWLNVNARVTSNLVSHTESPHDGLGGGGISRSDDEHVSRLVSRF